MLSEGNFGSTPVRELLSGAWNEDGIQATELLSAVRADLRVIEKEAEVALIPEERPAPLAVCSGIQLLVSSGIGAPILSLSEFCGLVSRDPSLSGTLVPCESGCLSLDRCGSAGSRVGLVP
jgi:hypothetical protein